MQVGTLICSSEKRQLLLKLLVISGTLLKKITTESQLRNAYVLDKSLWGEEQTKSQEFCSGIISLHSFNIQLEKHNAHAPVIGKTISISNENPKQDLSLCSYSIHELLCWYGTLCGKENNGKPRHSFLLQSVTTISVVVKCSIGTQDEVLLDQCNQELLAGFSRSDTVPNTGNRLYFPTIFVFAMCMVGLTATHTVFSGSCRIP